MKGTKSKHNAKKNPPKRVPDHPVRTLLNSPNNHENIMMERHHRLYENSMRTYPRDVSLSQYFFSFFALLMPAGVLISF